MKTNLTPADRDAMGCYLVTNSNTQETYVGSGILGDREKVHNRLLIKGTHFNRKLQNAYNKDSNFEFIGVPVEKSDNTPQEDRQVALTFEDNIIKEEWGNPLLLNLSSSAFKCRPEWTEEQIDISREATKQLWTNPEYREKVTAAFKKTSQEPELRKLRSENAKKYSDQPEVKAVRSELLVDKWKDPEYREKTSAHLKEIVKDPLVMTKRVSAFKDTVNTHEGKEQRSKIIKGLFDNDEYRAANKDRMVEFNRQRSNPISLNGVQYSSLREAARETNLTRQAIKKILK